MRTRHQSGVAGLAGSVARAWARLARRLAIGEEAGEQGDREQHEDELVPPALVGQHAASADQGASVPGAVT